jgi:1-acyl-sn-glycerol-3-phosphate acyltransferase
MNLLKNILGRIFALWAFVVFTSSLLVIIIPVWITGFLEEPRKTAYSFTIFRAWMKFFFFFSGVRRVITGKENFEKGETYVIVFNHRTFMDVPVSTVGIPGTNKTIAKVEISRVPLFGLIYKRGSVLVDRKSEESRRLSYVKMKEVLQMGMHMAIYPEGTRNKTTEPLQRFHDGAFRLAADSGKAIIPAVIIGTNDVMPTQKTFFFWPRPVAIHFLPPIPVENKTTQELKDEAFMVMKEALIKADARYR